MRIIRVALVFFSIGFLVSSIEEAAGLGHPEETNQVASTLAASVDREGPREHFGHAVMRPGQAAAAEPIAVLPFEYSAEPLNRELAKELLAATPELRGPLFQAKRSLSEPDAHVVSRMPVPKWMSSAGDPLGPAPETGTSSETAQLLQQEFIMPFQAGRVTSLFNQGRRHPAIDLAGPLGTPVHATTSGQRVIFAGWRGGYGNCVMAQDGQGRVHLYGHLRSIATKVGTLLQQGQKLGLLGSTGHSTGPHVHYEVRTRNGGHINPVTLLFPGRRVSKGLAWSDAHAFGRVAAVRADDQPRAR